jgi:hypothetical protein
MHFFGTQGKTEVVELKPSPLSIWHQGKTLHSGVIASTVYPYLALKNRVHYYLLSLAN